MNISAEEFIKENVKAILPHLLEAGADNQVGSRSHSCGSALTVVVWTLTFGRSDLDL